MAEERVESEYSQNLSRDYSSVTSTKLDAGEGRHLRLQLFEFNGPDRLSIPIDFHNANDTFPVLLVPR